MEVRFVAWLVWRIHLAFRQMGVGGGMGCQFALAFLKNLPLGVVLELAEASQEAFDWLAEHFPDVNRENPGLQRCASLLHLGLLLSPRVGWAPICAGNSPKNLPFAAVLGLAKASQEAFDLLAEHFPDVNWET